MPLAKGSSQKTISANISELHGGNVYAHTKEKFGKKRADSQSVAIALAESRKSKKRDRRDVKYY